MDDDFERREAERREAWRQEEQNRARRLEFLRRLEEILRARGWKPWLRADARETVELKFTLEELAELVGALHDALDSFSASETAYARGALSGPAP